MKERKYEENVKPSNSNLERHKKKYPILFRDKLRYFQFETNNNISILHADKLRNVFQFEPTINISNITRR